MSLFDEGSPLYAQMKDSIVLDPEGKMMNFGWQGPDTVKRTWKMSVASPAWRNHLLKQAQWIMELLDPDAIVIDETFASLGYDHHPQRQGPLSPGGIELIRKMRALVRSFGPNKALLVSDILDIEHGDVGRCRRRRPRLSRDTRPSTLPAKSDAIPSRSGWQAVAPCAWYFQKMWPLQIELARAVGAGVGVSNGWLEYTGLARFPDTIRRNMIRDIESLRKA